MLAVVMASTTALGQAAPKGGGAGQAPAGSQAVVDQLYEAGLAAANRKDWKTAAEKFAKAYSLEPLPQIAGNLSEAELKLGRYRDAAEHADAFIRLDKGAPASEKKLAQGWLDEAKKKIVTLKITVVDKGAEVLIDGKPVGTSPLPPEVYVDPGKHTVEARSGSARDEVTDTYEAGWTRVIKLVPKGAPVAGPTATATATASVAPTVSPTAGGDQGGPNKKILIGGAAFGGAMLVAGGIFAGLSASRASDAGGFGAWDKCYQKGLSPGTDYSRCPELHQAYQDVALFGDLSTAMFIGGVAVGVATALHFVGILPPGQGSKKAAIIAMPVVASSGGGVSVTGQF